jgi:ribosomal-protein-alanine N-acetyltransferase
MLQLKTDRLIIRNPERRDLPDWHRLMSDPVTMYYLNDLMTHSEEESRQNLSDAIAESALADRKKYFFAMELRDSGNYVGNIGYTVINDTLLGKIAGVGYFILPEYRGKGYVTEALREILRFGFEENNVRRFEAGCCVENTTSEKVMRKCGMIRESDMKECFWHDGKLKDRVTYRLLRNEWKIEWMAEYKQDDGAFWSTLDKLVSESGIVIDRLRGSKHLRYPDFVYPLDYGYLKNTSSMDGTGIDVWKGAHGDKADAVVCTLDLFKKDSEIKILIGCNEEEKQLVLKAHNESELQKGVMIRRYSEIME